MMFVSPLSVELFYFILTISAPKVRLEITLALTFYFALICIPAMSLGDLKGFGSRNNARVTFDCLGDVFMNQRNSWFSAFPAYLFWPLVVKQRPFNLEDEG